MPRTKLVRACGGDGGGKAADRREGERRRMPRAQNRNRHVTEAVNLRIGGVQNRDHVRPSIGARCGKAARRDLCRGAGATRFPTATAESVIALTYPAGNAQLIDVTIDAVKIPDGAKNVMVAVSGFENGSACRRRLLSSLDRDDALNMT